MDTLLFFHASAELYGSDRTLLELVRGLDRRRWRPVVALPRAGALARELRSAGAVVETGPVGTFGRATLRPRGLLRAARTFPHSVAWARWLVRAHKPSLVHTNTLVVLSGALAARAECVPHLWHVHEILERPRVVAGLVARTVAGLSQSVVCNSHATAANLRAFAPALDERCSVVHNGIREFERRPTRAAARNALGLDSDEACVALVGRINRYKGHALLLDACARLRPHHPRLRILFCGDAPPGQPELQRALEAQIARSGLAERVRILPFRDDIELVYAAADVVALPSTQPESFGLVALEAMSLERPVVAAAHGGPLEILEDGATGLLFPAHDAGALASALSALLADPARAERLGRAGRVRQLRQFTLARYVREFERLYAGLLPQTAILEVAPRRMKIIHLLLGKANPERPNGVNRVVDGLAGAQLRAGAQVEVWGITGTPAGETPAREYPLRLFPPGSNRFRLARELRLALEDLVGEALVHFHGGYHPEFHAAAKLLALRGQGWIVTPHGAFRTAVVRAAWIKKRTWLALLEKRLLERARAVQVFSEREADELRVYAARARIVVLPNGIDRAQLGEARAVGSNPARLVFGFLGRLDQHTKGLDLLLDGFAHYSRAGGSGELSLVGAGPDERALRRRAAEIERVQFHGELFGGEKRARLAAMDVFLHPSRHEGMPMAVLEAAGTGLPCVLSRATNLAEVFARHAAGLVLEGESSEEIARALAHCEVLARAGALARMGQAARALVAQEFDLRTLGERSLGELYGALAPATGAAA